MFEGVMAALHGLTGQDIANYGTSIAAIIVAAELFFVWREANRERTRNRKLETLNILATYLDVFVGFSVWLRGVIAERENAMLNLSQKEEERIREYLRIAERVGTGVRHGVYSAEVLVDVLSKPFRRNYLTLKPFVDKIRRDAGTDRIWENYEWLCFELETRSPEAILPKDWKCPPMRQIAKD